MNKLKCLILVFLSAICINSFSQVDDAGLWASVSIDKKIGAGFTTYYSQEFRFNENISELGTSFSEIGLEHKIIKKLTGSISYRFIQNRRKDDSYSFRHRLNLDLAYRLKWKKLTAAIRGRYQNQVRDVQSSPEGFSPVSYLRSKLTLKYNFEKKYTPFLASELFFQLNNPNGNELDNLRYTCGLDYKFNKKSSVTLFYMINKEVNVNDPWTNYNSGINYSYSF